MIERLDWSHSSHRHELPSPFMRGKGERSLRITLHSDSLTKLRNEEMEAVVVLCELGHLPEVKVLETQPANYPHIEIGVLDPGADVIPVQIVWLEEPQCYTGILHPRQWPGIAARLVGETNPNHENAKAMLEALLVAEAHCSVEGDVLVTSSHLLLGHRSKNFLREANIRTPIEAVKIVGLFLRSRNVYTCRAGPKSRYNLGRGLFYQVLTHTQLPRVWQYCAACRAAGKVRGDDLSGLGESILVRSMRALEARDYIGVQFYQPQNNETRDRIMYHFHYLTLLLAGIIDAQARITNIAYQVFPKKREVSFRWQDFVEALSRKGAAGLYDLVREQRFKDVTSLLYELRNTIHAAALRTIGYHAVPEPEHTFIAVPPDIDSLIWGAAERCGSEQRWGLTKSPRDILLEPYSYATALVEEGLCIVDGIAANTDIRRLFPSDQTPPVFPQAPPADSLFEWAERVALLA